MNLLWQSEDELDITKMYVWHIQNPPRSGKFYEVANVDDAIKIIDALADEDLKNDSIVANAFGMVVYEDGEWLEYEDEEGRDVDEIAKLKGCV